MSYLAIRIRVQGSSRWNHLQTFWEINATENFDGIGSLLDSGKELSSDKATKKNIFGRIAVLTCIFV